MASLRIEKGILFKNFTKLFLPLAVILISVTLVLYYSDVKTKTIILKANEKNDVALELKSIKSDFKALVSDLRFLSMEHELRHLVDDDKMVHIDDLKDDYLTFSREKGVYDQIRFINNDGMEIIRINYNNGHPNIVPDNMLQDKLHRYYFQESIVLNAGEVFISPLDLNIENKKIEKPQKPMIRLATPVFNSKSEKKGIIIFNYLAGILIKHFSESCLYEDNLSLLNPDGYWLYSNDQENTFGFMYEEKKDLKYGRFYYDAWERATRAASGQFINRDGLFTFQRVYPLLEVNSAWREYESSNIGKEYYWIIVSHVTDEVLTLLKKDTLFKHLRMFSVLFVLLAVSVWLFSQVSLLKKRAECVLLEHKAKLDGIIKSITDGLIVTNENNEVMLMNPSAEKIFQVSLENAFGGAIDNIVKEKQLCEDFKCTIKNKTKGHQFDFKLGNNGSNSKRIMRARTSVIYDGEKKKKGVVTIINDVTDEREIERMKTEFLSTAAHELRSPMTSIRGFSEILLTRENLKSEEKKKFLSYIQEQSVNLCEIINDLLDISRIESGKGFAIDKNMVNVSKIIDHVVDRFKSQSDKHEFNISLPKDDIELNVDKDKFNQLLVNIISNAVKYSPYGGRIKVSGLLSGAEAQFTVEDEGIGMTREQVARVFDKFYRADTSNSAVEGTGLGMTIVKYIVQAHGGEVVVDSELGKGTVLRFNIPVKAN